MGAVAEHVLLSGHKHFSLHHDGIMLDSAASVDGFGETCSNTYIWQDRFSGAYD